MVALENDRLVEIGPKRQIVPVGEKRPGQGGDATGREIADAPAADVRRGFRRPGDCSESGYCQGFEHRVAAVAVGRHDNASDSKPGPALEPSNPAKRLR